MADSEKIMNVTKYYPEDYKKGHDVVVVLSATGKTTDKLITQVNKINPRPPKWEIGMLLVIGR